MKEISNFLFAFYFVLFLIDICYLSYIYCIVFFSIFISILVSTNKKKTAPENVIFVHTLPFISSAFLLFSFFFFAAIQCYRHWQFNRTETVSVNERKKYQFLVQKQSSSNLIMLSVVRYNIQFKLNATLTNRTVESFAKFLFLKIVLQFCKENKKVKKQKKKNKL